MTDPEGTSIRHSDGCRNWSNGAARIRHHRAMAGSKKSAGILLYRLRSGELEVFLVHPGGPFWARKDAGAWTIPKGEIDEGEDPRAAALREFREETGMACPGTLTELAPVRQAGGKTVLAWAVEGDCDAAAIESNTFELEWPPKSGRVNRYPEVDRAGWFAIAEARGKILGGQAPLLDQLLRIVGARDTGSG
jgi:predicted NUDIX family NTP pyrophosphohydrolase